MLHPIHKTALTWLVHILTAVDRPHWEHNSNELTTIGPISIVAKFQFRPPTATWTKSDHAMPDGDSTLGSLRLSFVVAWWSNVHGVTSAGPQP